MNRENGKGYKKETNRSPAAKSCDERVFPRGKGHKIQAIRGRALRTKNGGGSTQGKDLYNEGSTLGNTKNGQAKKEENGGDTSKWGKRLLHCPGDLGDEPCLYGEYPHEN